jgi:4-hydroxy-tetrahydrodipicolinate reductase
VTRIAVVGAAGRMGREVVRAALEDDSFELAGGVVKPEAQELAADLGELCG